MDDEAGPTWSDIAGWYDDLVERGSGPHDTALRCLLDLVPPAGLASAEQNPLYTEVPIFFAARLSR